MHARCTNRGDLTPGRDRTKWSLLRTDAGLARAVGSLLIARHQAAIMDRQLAAPVWPPVEDGTSNLRDDGRPQRSLEDVPAFLGTRRFA